MNFTFQCQVVLGPKFKLAQAHEPGNMLSRADSLGTPRVAIPPRVLAAATLMQTRVVPKLRIGSSHTGAHIFTPQQTDRHTHTESKPHTCLKPTAAHMHIDPLATHKSLRSRARTALRSHTSQPSQHTRVLGSPAPSHPGCLPHHGTLTSLTVAQL